MLNVSINVIKRLSLGLGAWGGYDIAILLHVLHPLEDLAFLLIGFELGKDCVEQFKLPLLTAAPVLGILGLTLGPATFPVVDKHLEKVVALHEFYLLVQSETVSFDMFFPDLFS